MELLSNDTNQTFLNFSEDYHDEFDEEQLLKDMHEYIKPKLWTWCLIFAHFLVFIFGLVGNALVCVAVYRNRSMRTVTNYCIINLAVADFLVILICLPPSVVWDVTSTWFFGNIPCKIVLYLQTVSVTVSVLTLSFISIERWYAICFPLKFKSTTGRAKTAIGIIWIIALLFDVPELIVYHSKEQEVFGMKTHFFTQCTPSWSSKKNHIWNLLKMFSLYLIPLLIMGVTYSHIVYVLWKSKTSQHELDIVDNVHVYTFSMPQNASTRGQLRSRKKAAKMLISVVIMFAICYFPVHLHNVLRIVMKLSNRDGNRIFSFVSHWLCYANSAINPLIYNFMSEKFRKEFKRSYDCCRKSENRNRSDLLRIYKANSFLKSRTSSRLSKQRGGSDIKTVTTKVTD